MTVKELKQFLEKADENTEVAISLWTSTGEKAYRISHAPLGNPEVRTTQGEKYVRIAWVDVCPANRIKSIE